jgi:diamine N-acetyltransferase
MISYRMATEADAPALADMFARSFTETFGHLYRPEDLAAFLSQFEEAGWREELADPQLTIRLAEENGELAAFAKVGTITLPVEPDVPATELRQLYILKPWQGRGVAHALLDWALDEARANGARRVYLSVYIDNIRARRLYERYGFTFVAPYEFRVGDHSDEDLIMSLDL